MESGAVELPDYVRIHGLLLDLLETPSDHLKMSAAHSLWAYVDGSALVLRLAISVSETLPRESKFG